MTTEPSTSIDVPGATQTLAFKINNLGDIAVEWIDDNNKDHAALLKDGQYYTFGYPDFNQTIVYAINDFRYSSR